MFRFKDSNFYANQKCIPDFVSESSLQDGMCVQIDTQDHVAFASGSGGHIVLNEPLNRNEVHKVADGFGICHNAKHTMSGEKPRLYELNALIGVEFVTDDYKPTGVAPYISNKPATFSVGDWFGYDEGGVLVPEGSANGLRFVVTAIEGDCLVMVLCERPHVE